MRTSAFLFAIAGTALLAQQPVPPPKEAMPVQGVMMAAPTTMAFFGGELVGGPALTGAPYSADAVTQTTQTLADGNHIVNKSTSKIYRDSAGRERREQTLPKIGNLASADPGLVTIMISDPVAKVNYTLESGSKTAMKMPAPPMLNSTVMKNGLTVTTGMAGTGFTQAIGSGGNVMYSTTRVVSSPDSASAQKTEDLGHKVMEGVAVDGTRTITTIPAGQAGNDLALEVVSERWYSPELQVVVMSKHTDPRMGETTYQLTNVSRVEPAPSLFEVPPDYQVQDMSNGIQRIERRIQIQSTTGKDE